MEMYRLPGSTLQTGFAYIDRAHIPFTNPALLINAMDDIPDVSSITTQPGFAAAFNREINSNAIRNQLARFFNENKRKAGDGTAPLATLAVIQSQQQAGVLITYCGLPSLITYCGYHNVITYSKSRQWTRA